MTKPPLENPPTHLNFNDHADRWRHDGGWSNCPRCDYGKIEADQKFDAGEAEHDEVMLVEVIEFPIPETKATEIYVRYECCCCLLSGVVSFVGPRPKRDIIRKQMEFMRNDYRETMAKRIQGGE